MDNSLWSSLPKPMQEQFFNLADTETKKTKMNGNTIEKAFHLAVAF